MTSVSKVLATEDLQLKIVDLLLFCILYIYVYVDASTCRVLFMLE